MNSLADLPHPISPDHFQAGHVDRRPLHVPTAGDDRKTSILSWADFNLPGQGWLWTSNRLQRMRNHFAVPVESATLYRTTGRAFPENGPLIRRACDWILQRQFAVEDLVSEMGYLSEADIREAVAGAGRAGAVQRI